MLIRMLTYILRVIVKKLTYSLIFLRKFVYNVQLIMQFNSQFFKEETIKW